jgi:ankyrin repeat protein
MAPVHTAAFNGHLEEVQALVGRDPELLKSTASELHRTPLMAAVEGGKLHVVKWLLGHGANLNRYDLAGRTALVVGCSFGHEAVVELLLREGADPNDVSAASLIQLGDRHYNPSVLL